MAVWYEVAHIVQILNRWRFYKRKQFVLFINFAKFDAHSSPLFAKLKIIKLHDIIFLYTPCFMYQYSNCNLPSFLTQDLIMVLAWHKNPNWFFQKLERIMENFIPDICPKNLEQD